MDLRPTPEMAMERMSYAVRLAVISKSFPQHVAESLPDPVVGYVETCARCHMEGALVAAERSGKGEE